VGEAATAWLTRSWSADAGDRGRLNFVTLLVSNQHFSTCRSQHQGFQGRRPWRSAGQSDLGKATPDIACS